MPGSIRFTGKDGSDRIIEYRNILVKDQDGSLYVRGIARDITDLSREERTFSLTEERYRSILESIERRIL